MKTKQIVLLLISISLMLSIFFFYLLEIKYTADNLTFIQQVNIDSFFKKNGCLKLENIWYYEKDNTIQIWCSYNEPVINDKVYDSAIETFNDVFSYIRNSCEINDEDLILEISLGRGGICYVELTNYVIDIVCIDGTYTELYEFFNYCASVYECYYSDEEIFHEKYPEILMGRIRNDTRNCKRLTS